MKSGATSASSCAETAISSAISASGRFHSPAMRARATCTPRPGGARRLNCGSVILLADGMIIPIRARGAGSARSTCLCSSVAVASMIVSPKRLVDLQSGVPGEWRPIRIFRGDELLNFRNVEIFRQESECSEVLLDPRRFHGVSRGLAELADHLGRKALWAAEPEPGLAAHVGKALFGEGGNARE